MIENCIDIVIENNTTSAYSHFDVSASKDDSDALSATDGLVSLNQPIMPLNAIQHKIFFGNPFTHQNIIDMFASEPDWSRYPAGLKKENMKMYFTHKRAGGPVTGKLHGIDNNPLLDQIMKAKPYDVEKEVEL